ncbi:MAG: caspase domain-containing protein [Gammaproteobacteria bacterium]
MKFLRRKSLVKLISLMLFLPLQATSAYAVTDSRYALVIGNSNYQHAAKLKNPGNDSTDLAKTLRNLNFETTLIQNATKNQIKKSVEVFIATLKKSGGVGLFYYAGHGVQFEGSNYLIPIETTTGTEQQIKDQSYNIAGLLDGMRKINTATNIIILDACRNNPFDTISQYGTRSVTSSKSRSMVRVSIPKLDSGLSKLDAPSNTLIAFATAPGKVALDGDGRNSPYTLKLIESMQRTGLTIGEVFRQVRSSVVKYSNGRQIPWESSSLIQDFYFKHRTFIPMGF